MNYLDYANFNHLVGYKMYFSYSEYADLQGYILILWITS